MLKKVLVLFLLPSIIFLSLASEKEPSKYAYKANQSRWVDSVFNALDADERIGQLFMVAAYSNQNEKHQKENQVGDPVRGQFVQGCGAKDESDQKAK